VCWAVACGVLVLLRPPVVQPETHLLMTKAGWLALWSRMTCWLLLSGAPMMATRLSTVSTPCRTKHACAESAQCCVGTGCCCWGTCCFVCVL
jgi:hypothetical protein